jgi:hypothetical protein
MKCLEVFTDNFNKLVAFHRTQLNNAGVTASLTVDYRSPMPAESYIVFVVKIVKNENLKWYLEGEARRLF